MNTVAEIVALLRKQTELESRILSGELAVGAEQELEITLRRLTTHPQALNAVLQTARALRRTPDTISVRDVTDFGGSSDPQFRNSDLPT
jgi:hypothetical protein